MIDGKFAVPKIHRMNLDIIWKKAITVKPILLC
jgi:hypothetical protein